MEVQKYEYVKSLKLAGYLMMNGFRIIKVMPNIKFKKKDVYVFEQSEELSSCIFEYIKSRTKENGCIGIDNKYGNYKTHRENV